MFVEHVSVHGRPVEILRRPYKRSLGLTVKVNGTIRVSAPKGLSTEKICDFVASQSEWIETNLKKYEVVRRAYPAKQMRAGELFPFLGENFELRFEESTSARTTFDFREGQLVAMIARAEWSSFDPLAAHPELFPDLCAFYKKQARDVLTKTVHRYSSAMMLMPTALSFRAQKTRWGSCSSKGRISLNWKLIIAPCEVIDYVVVHELSHLQYYDHSKKFWSLVAAHVPNYLQKRSWLRENQFLADFLSLESELHPSSGHESTRYS